MTTASTTSVLNHGTVAGYNAWVSEQITAIFTTLGLTQTTDTGQTTNGGSSIPAINTAGGYVIGKFNDTAQSTSPVFFKLEFGTGSSSSQPQMWVTVGQGSNGSGTLTGTLMARSTVFCSNAVSSTTTSYVSRYCWNATAGFFGFVFKINATITGAAYGGIFLFRDNNASGASTTNSVTLITNSNNTTALAQSNGNVQTYSYLTASLLTLPTVFLWSAWYYALTSTTYSSQVQVAPAVFLSPVLYISACVAICLVAEIPVGNTVSMALVGSSTATYLCVANNPFGTNSFPSGIAGITLTPANNGVLMLWQ